MSTKTNRPTIVVVAVRACVVRVCVVVRAGRYNIWNIDGSLHHNERIETELYHVGFRPGTAAEYPRPPSPKKYLGAQAFAAAAPKAYVPGQGLSTRTAVGGAGAGRSMVAGMPLYMPLCNVCLCLCLLSLSLSASLSLSLSTVSVSLSLSLWLHRLQSSPVLCCAPLLLNG
jgi:hypothetical protein